MNEEKILKVLVKKSWLILIITFIITGFTAFYFFYTTQPVYQAKTTLHVTATTNNQKSVITSDNIAVSQQLVRDYSEFIKSEKIITYVIEKLGMNGVTKESLATSVDINIVKDSNLLQLVVTDTDPERARIVANTFSQVLIEQIATITNQTNLSIVDAAKLSVYPMKTYKATKVFASFVISFLIMCVLVIALEYINNTVHTVKDVEIELGYHVIGIIPKMRD